MGIKLGKKSKMQATKCHEPDKDQAEDIAHFIKTLEDNKQVSHKRGRLAPGETHEQTTTSDGEKTVKRKRFSAI